MNISMNRTGTVIFCIAVLVLLPLSQSAFEYGPSVGMGSALVNGNIIYERENSSEMEQFEVRAGVGGSFDVPFWQVGDTWTYYSTLTSTSTDQPDDYLTIWMNITYTVAGVEHYNKNGTLYLAYNLTTTGGVVGKGFVEGREVFLDGKSGGQYDFSQKASLSGYRIVRTSDLSLLYDEFISNGHLHTLEWIFWVSVPGSLLSKFFDADPIEGVDFPAKDGDMFWHNTTQRRVFNIEVDFEDMSRYYDHIGQNNYTTSAASHVQNTVIAGTFDTYFLDGTAHKGSEDHDRWYSPRVKNLVREDRLDIKLSETARFSDRRELRSYDVLPNENTMELFPSVNFPGTSTEVSGVFPNDPNRAITVEMPFTGDTWQTLTDGSGNFRIDIPVPVLAGDLTNTTIDNGSFGVCVFMETSPNNKVVSRTLTIVASDDVAPVSHAGSSLSIPEDVQYMLNGSDSTDNCAIINYTWTVEVGAGSTMELYGIMPLWTFTTPGNYSVTLEVTDIGGNTDTDTIHLTVLDITPPVAIQTLFEAEVIHVGAQVFLDGSGSYDPENGEIVNYTWHIQGEYPYDETFYGMNVSYIFTRIGDLTITLTIFDISLNAAVSTVNITVVDELLPTANAGEDITVNQHESVMFNGSLSIDNVGVVEYNWTFIYADALRSLFGVSPIFTFDIAGTYVVTLQVKDQSENTGSDALIVVVRDITPPMAAAGPDLRVDQGAQVVFNGSGSSDNIGIMNYTWTFVDVDEKVLAGLSPTYTFGNAGVFEVLLNVTDSAGNWHTDVLSVVVNDSAPPKARAGPDLMVLPGTNVTFNASDSSDNVGVVEYYWRFQYDGKPYQLRGQTATFEFDILGTYNVTLDVVDAAGNAANDEMIVTVKDDISPTANAGRCITVNVGDLVSFDGRASADDGGIDNYFWSFIYDGSEQILSGDEPNFIFNIAGNYTITLNVTDTSGNWAVDEIWVNVIGENDGEAGGLDTHKTSTPFQWWTITVIVVILLLGAAVFIIVQRKKGMKLDDDEKMVEKTVENTVEETEEEAER